MVIFRKMPLLKAARYIIAQIFGSFIAVLLVYAQYHDTIKLVEAGLKAKGVYDLIQFTPSGPAGILALYVAPGTNLARVLLNEFITVSFKHLLLAIYLKRDLRMSFCLSLSGHVSILPTS